MLQYSSSIKPKSQILFDMQESARTVDANGYLCVKDCVITRAEVSPYKGHEIKNWQQLGLQSDKIYNVFRPLSAIENALDTYNNMPLTDDHIEIRPEAPMRERILGWSGSNAHIEDGEVLNDIHVFVGKGIQDIEKADNYIEGKGGNQDKGKKALSAGYAYDVTPEEGQYNGVPYQFKMDNLRCNHIALVAKGRVPTAGIADSAEFLESEHPRAENGEFTNGSGSSSNSKESESTSKSNSQTKTESFKKWFGNSKIVDDKGEPLVVYHGTNEDFSEFNKSNDIGFHFGSKAQAQEFATAENSKIHPVYLKMNNPLELDFDPTIIDPDAYNNEEPALFNTLRKITYEIGINDIYEPIRNGDKQVEKILDLANKFDKKALKIVKSENGDIRDIFGEKTYSDFWQNMQKWLQSKNYDGIIYENGLEGNTGSANNLSYSVFSAEQIKSATGNKGTFDPKSKNINDSEKSMKDKKKAYDAQGMAMAKKILDIARDEDFEGEEDDRVDAILKAATELRAINEKESVHSATDSGETVFKKEPKVSKFNVFKAFFAHDAEMEEGKEKEKDCADKKMKDAMSIMKTMKDVAMRDASEFEGGEKEKGKTLMDLAASMKDEEESEEGMTKEEKEEYSREKADDKKAKDKKMKDKKAKDEFEEGKEKLDVKNEEVEPDDTAKDMAFDALVARKVQETIRIQNKVASLCQSVVGRLPEAMLMDSNPEKMIDYTLTQKGKSIAGKSLDVKLAMVEMLKAPHLSLAMDSRPSNSNTPYVSILETMKGR